MRHIVGIQEGLASRKERLASLVNQRRREGVVIVDGGARLHCMVELGDSPSPSFGKKMVSVGLGKIYLQKPVEVL